MYVLFIGVRKMPSEKVTIRIDLEGDLAKYFLYLKKRKGIKNNSELVRMLIVQEYERLAGPQQIS